MSKEDLEDENWVAEAQVSASSAAASEFERYVASLKRKAGLNKAPAHIRAYRSMVAILKRLVGYFG